MKEVVNAIGEIFVGIGMFAVIFFIAWILTSFDVIGVFFVSTVLGQKFLQQEIIAQNNTTQYLTDGLFYRRYNRHHKIEY